MSRILLRIFNSISFTLRLTILFVVFLLLSAEQHKTQTIKIY